MFKAGQSVDLSPTEFKLLRFLMANAGRVMSKAQILDHVWHYDFGGEATVVETYVSYLRRKVDTTDPRLLHTVRGVGYVLRVPRGPDARPAWRSRLSGQAPALAAGRTADASCRGGAAARRRWPRWPRCAGTCSAQVDRNLAALATDAGAPAGPNPELRPDGPAPARPGPLGPEVTYVRSRMPPAPRCRRSADVRIAARPPVLPELHRAGGGGTVG